MDPEGIRICRLLTDDAMVVDEIVPYAGEGALLLVHRTARENPSLLLIAIAEFSERLIRAVLLRPTWSERLHRQTAHETTRSAELRQDERTPILRKEIGEGDGQGADEPREQKVR